MRTFAALEQHIAAEREDGIDIALYASATVAAHGATVEIDTAYPADGLVRIRVSGDATEGRRRLALRVPGWTAGATVALHRDGTPVDVVVDNGWILLEDALGDGTSLELQLPVTVSVVRPDPRIDAVRGTVTLRRGPVVYCAVGDVEDVTIDAAADAQESADTHGPLGPRLELAAQRRTLPAETTLYAADPTAQFEDAVLHLRPFAEFDGGEAMRVWLPTR